MAFLHSVSLLSYKKLITRCAKFWFSGNIAAYSIYIHLHNLDSVFKVWF